jgi:hypothetical protein
MDAQVAYDDDVLPPTRSRYHAILAPMKVGQSLPLEPHGLLRASILAYSHYHRPSRWIVRKTPDGYRVWRTH